MKTVVVVFALLLAVVSARPEYHGNNNRCSGVEDGTKFPNMNDCYKYVECFNGAEFPKSCQGHYKFDAVSLKCSEKSEVSCFHGPTTTTTTTAKTSTTQKPSTTTTKHTTTKKPSATTTQKPTTTTTKHTTTKKPSTTTTQKPATTTTQKPTTTTTKHTTPKKPSTTTTHKPTTTKKPPTTTTQKPTTTTKRTTTKKPTTERPSTTPVPTCNTQYEQNCAMYWSCATGELTLEACLDGYIFYEPLHSCLPGDTETCEPYHTK